jgi:hypothetical protein
MSRLSGATNSFVERYHAHAALVMEQRDWTLRITLVASDSGAVVTLRLIEGRVAEVTPELAAAEVVITSDEQTLCDILELRRGPNEPYLFGDLTVRGPERDFLRLDYIASVLCPE